MRKKRKNNMDIISRDYLERSPRRFRLITDVIGIFALSRSYIPGTVSCKCEFKKRPKSDRRPTKTAQLDCFTGQVSKGQSNK